ncbi:MAG: methyltransferase [Actinomycetota bacterium]|nr:methyltransferase [Actinomycetota bacterium]
MNIRFDHRVLRPRPWTIAQSEWVLELIDDLPDGSILELCAGVGQIGLAVVLVVPRQLVLVDANPAACTYARENAHEAGLTSVEFRTGLMDQVLAPDERFALIIADPPWVPSADTARFPEDPPLAIDGGADGLTLVRTCVRLISDHLLGGGAAILQVGGAAQVAAVRTFIGTHPTIDLTIRSVREPAGGGALILLTCQRSGVNR